MAKMLMGQIDHARSRVRAIKNGLIGNAPKAEKSYVISDLVKGLRDGSVSFTGTQLRQFAEEWAEQYQNDSSRYSRTTFESVVLDNAFAAERLAEKARFEKENTLYQVRVQKVNDEAVAVEDAIVLGDNAAALAALQSFAAFKL